MATLYEIVQEDRYLTSLLADPSIDEQVIKDTLEGITTELELKVESYIKVMRNLEADMKAFEEEAKFYSEKASTIKNNIKRLKDTLCNAMITTGHDDKEGLKAGNFVLKVAGNGGKQPLVIDGEVPDNYTRIIVEADTEKIRTALESGEVLPFAHLEPRGKHLSIK